MRFIGRTYKNSVINRERDHYRLKVLVRLHEGNTEQAIC